MWAQLNCYCDVSVVVLSTSLLACVTSYLGIILWLPLQLVASKDKMCTINVNVQYVVYSEWGIVSFNTVVVLLIKKVSS